MPNSTACAVLRQIHRSVDPCDHTQLTDRELLERFSHLKDEGAFTAIVSRHGDMVLAASRRALGNSPDAEDVCQAAFLLLAKNASSPGWQPSVANWLYKTAYQLALKTRTATMRRARREGTVTREPSTNPLAEITGQELLTTLDEELLRLPESLRTPLVLCYFEGLTRDMAARRLGYSLATLKKRLECGREKLHIALVRRGLSLPAVLICTLSAQQTTNACATNLLAHKTVQAALMLTAGKSVAGVISTQVIQLVEGGLRMTWNKTRVSLALLVVSSLLSVAGAFIYNAPDDKQVPLPANEVSAAVDAKTEQPTTPTKETPRTLRVIVLDPQGKPLPNSNIHVGVWTNEKDFKHNREYETDSAGVALIELPKTFSILRLWASKKPLITMFAAWEQAELTSTRDFPNEYTFHLESGVAAGGRIVDEQGKPIPGAKVQVNLADDLKPISGEGHVRYSDGLAEGDGALTTDATGRWRITSVPDNPRARLILMISHPDYVSDEEWGQAQKAASITLEMLRQETATLRLKRGIIVRGRVTDPTGKPIKDAIIVQGNDPYGAFIPKEFPTDSDGQFRLPALAPGPTNLTAIAPGWAPQLRPITVQDGLPAQEFRMEPGKTIRLRIVDPAGHTLSKASVSLVEWKGGQSLYNHNHPKVRDTKIPRETDADGIWEWTWAPDSPVKLSIYREGFASYELEIAGGAPERTVTLKPEHRILGLVTDAVIGKPIPNFTVFHIVVFNPNFLCAERGNAERGRDGRFSLLATRTDYPLRLRVEATGYRTQDGPEFRVGDNSSRSQDFRLQPSPPVTGAILDVNGQPAKKVEVLFATPSEGVHLSPDHGEPRHRVFTDADGRFAFPDPGEPWAVIARAESGTVLAEFPATQHDAGTIRLQPWASVRGVFRDGGKPISGATIFLTPIRIHDPSSRPYIDATIQTVTGPDGKFEFPRVPPGPVSVRVLLGPWEDATFRSGPSMPLELQPGQRQEVDLGGTGAMLTGKVKLTGNVPADLDCTYSLNYLVRRSPGITPPKAIADFGFDIRNGWRDSWDATPEGRAYVSSLAHWFVKLKPDGSFRISGVPPGEYDLAVKVYAKPSGCLVDPLASNLVRVTVTAADVARGQLEVPEITATVEPVPGVGDTPKLTFERPDGTAGKLADYGGGYTLVHFWASWCGPCKKQIPALRREHERFSARGLTILGLALDDDRNAWQAAMKQLDLPWKQGKLTTTHDAGVSGVPAYWLLDPKGKIVAKGYDLNELDKLLEERLKP